jgi:hypothetical protein
MGCPSPTEVISMYGGRCPECGAQLQRPSVRDIVVDTATRYAANGGGYKAGARVTVSVKLPRWLADAARSAAEKRGVSLSELIREAILASIHSIDCSTVARFASSGPGQVDVSFKTRREIIARVDAKARECSVSRSQVIRACLALHLGLASAH